MANISLSDNTAYQKALRDINEAFTKALDDEVIAKLKALGWTPPQESKLVANELKQTIIALCEVDMFYEDSERYKKQKAMLKEMGVEL